MQRVTEHVDTAYLEQAPPRPTPPGLLMNLCSDYLLDRPLRTFFTPLTIACVLALFALYFLHASPLLRAIPAIIILVEIGLAARRIWRRVRDDLALLTNGLIIRAHVLRLRPHRSPSGALEGALLDCAIRVGPRRTYVGSIWLADGAEAQRLAQQGRVSVLCLPRTPGTWRVLEDVQSDIRYDRMGPMQAIPSDV